MFTHICIYEHTYMSQSPRLKTIYAQETLMLNHR